MEKFSVSHSDPIMPPDKLKDRCSYDFLRKDENVFVEAIQLAGSLVDWSGLAFSSHPSGARMVSGAPGATIGPGQRFLSMKHMTMGMWVTPGHRWEEEWAVIEQTAVSAPQCSPQGVFVISNLHGTEVRQSSSSGVGMQSSKHRSGWPCHTRPGLSPSLERLARTAQNLLCSPECCQGGRRSDHSANAAVLREEVMAESGTRARGELVQRRPKLCRFPGPRSTGTCPGSHVTVA